MDSSPCSSRCRLLPDSGRSLDQLGGGTEGTYGIQFIKVGKTYRIWCWFFVHSKMPFHWPSLFCQLYNFPITEYVRWCSLSNTYFEIRLKRVPLMVRGHIQLNVWPITADVWWALKFIRHLLIGQKHWCVLLSDHCICQMIQQSSTE